MLAALPRHIAQLAAILMGFWITALGAALFLVPERMMRGRGWALPTRNARALGGVLVVAGPVIGVLVFRAGGGCPACPPWGRPADRVLYAVWLAVFGYTVVRLVIRAVSSTPRGPEEPKDPA